MLHLSADSSFWNRLPRFLCRFATWNRKHPHVPDHQWSVAETDDPCTYHEGAYTFDNFEQSTLNWWASFWHCRYFRHKENGGDSIIRIFFCFFGAEDFGLWGCISSSENVSFGNITSDPPTMLCTFCYFDVHFLFQAIQCPSVFTVHSRLFASEKPSKVWGSSKKTHLTAGSQHLRKASQRFERRAIRMEQSPSVAVRLNRYPAQKRF